MHTVSDIHNCISEGFASLSAPKEPWALYEPAHYMIAAGGKRLRPTLCLLAYQLFQDHIDNQVLYPALGLEVFHAFTLVHDDIMDAAELRRGQPTVHRKWDTNRAILSGDVMCIDAFSLMQHCPPQLMPQILNVFSRTAAQVCEGQQYDMSYEYLRQISMQDYLHMISLKTAVLIAAAAQIGGFCAEASEQDARHLYDFGHALGLGFQIRDDYLDSFGHPDTFGKSIGSDILNNKKTWLLVQALQEAKAHTLSQLQRLVAMNHSPEEKIEGITEIYRQLDIPQAAENTIREFHHLALQALDRISCPDARKDTLRQYTQSLLIREK